MAKDEDPMVEYLKKFTYLAADDFHELVVKDFGEPLDGDQIEVVVKAFTERIRELNGDIDEEEGDERKEENRESCGLF